METSSNAARRDPEVRAALKEQQLARVAIKKRVAAGEIEASEYSAMYEKQPEQVARRRVQDAESAKRRAARKTANAVALNNAYGGAEVFKGAE